MRTTNKAAPARRVHPVNSDVADGASERGDTVVPIAPVAPVAPVVEASPSSAAPADEEMGRDVGEDAQPKAGDGDGLPEEPTSDLFSGASAESSRQPPARFGLGTRLRTARESQNLLAADLAFQLKVGVRKIEAIEEERWDLLPEGPYLRGLLRNYAKILKVDSAGLYEDIDAQVARAAAPSDFSLLPSLRTPFPQRSRPHESAVTRFMRVGTLLFALLAGLIGWSGTDSFRHSEERMTTWLENRGKPEGSLTAPASEGAGTESIDAVAPKVTRELVHPPETTGPAISKPAAAPPPAALPATIAAISNAGPGSSADTSTPQALSGDIVMRFNDDSWVEVRQADGKILMSQLNHAGAGKALDGAPPLELVIGNAPGVALLYRGSTVDLAPYTRDRVAHITLK